MKIKCQHIIITGAPGTGKTTLGQQLSEQTGLPLLSLDTVQAERGNRFPGSREAQRRLRQLSTPHVIEGASALWFPKSLLDKHDVRLLESPDDVLLRRLTARGLQDSEGVLLRGVKDEEIIRKRIAVFKKIVEDYKTRMMVAAY